MDKMHDGNFFKSQKINQFKRQVPKVVCSTKKCFPLWWALTPGTMLLSANSILNHRETKKKIKTTIHFTQYAYQTMMNIEKKTYQYEIGENICMCNWFVGKKKRIKTEQTIRRKLILIQQCVV